MLNVRFENTEEGLKAIYNAAPVISLVPESNNSSRIQNTSKSIVNLGEFSHYLGETYKLTENMQVTDDKDGKIDVDKITATYEKVVSSENTNTPETSENARATLENGQESTENSSGNNETTGNVKKSLPTEVGTYTVTYVVKDSWGREAKASRALTVKNGIERHELLFGGRDSNDRDVTAFKLKLREDESTHKPKISFEPLVDKIIATSHGIPNYYNIEIFRESSGNSTNQNIFSAPVDAQDNPRHQDYIMKGIENKEFEYGDKIKIRANQTPNFSIKGEILGDVKEDYSTGVENKMNLEYVVFEITREGLKAIYNDTDLNDSVKNVITNIDRGGLQAFKIKFNTSNTNGNGSIGRIDIDRLTGTIIYQDNENALTITLVREGQNTITHTFIGTNTGQDSGFNQFNNKYVKDGDYIEFWAKVPNRLFMTGNVIDTVNNHDYSKGATAESFTKYKILF